MLRGRLPGTPGDDKQPPGFWAAALTDGGTYGELWRRWTRWSIRGCWRGEPTNPMIGLQRRTPDDLSIRVLDAMGRRRRRADFYPGADIANEGATAHATEMFRLTQLRGWSAISLRRGCAATRSCRSVEDGYRIAVPAGGCERRGVPAPRGGGRDDAPATGVAAGPRRIAAAPRDGAAAAARRSCRRRSRPRNGDAPAECGNELLLPDRPPATISRIRRPTRPCITRTPERVVRERACCSSYGDRNPAVVRARARAGLVQQPPRWRLVSPPATGGPDSGAGRQNSAAAIDASGLARRRIAADRAEVLTRFDDRANRYRRRVSGALREAGTPGELLLADPRDVTCGPWAIRLFAQ